MKMDDSSQETMRAYKKLYEDGLLRRCGLVTYVQDNLGFMDINSGAVMDGLKLYFRAIESKRLPAFYCEMAHPAVSRDSRFFPEWWRAQGDCEIVDILEMHVVVQLHYLNKPITAGLHQIYLDASPMLNTRLYEAMNLLHIK